LVLVLVMVAGCGGEDPGSPSEGSETIDPSTTGSSAAQRFLDSYLADDGRVVRHDQGGDIVSEGQAYGMLLAQLAGRQDLVPTIWAWTREHLQRPDGLLSFRADADGVVVGADPASDADVLAAYALLRYDGDAGSSLHRDGQALAKAVLHHEVVTDAEGRPVLVAGPWAAETSIVNPSYLMPSVFEELGVLTGNETWAQLAESATPLVSSATDDGSLLPPDWARLDGSGLVPVADADGAAGAAQYGPDAQRVPLWFAHACSDDARTLAGRWWQLLQQDDRSRALALSVRGDVRDPAPQPLALLAAGASAAAAGDGGAADDLDRGAAEAAGGSPSYYGDAWVALAEGLRDGRLVSCG
jgi:endoglucanase